MPGQKPVLTESTIANERDAVIRQVWGVASGAANISDATMLTDIDRHGTDAFMRVTEMGKFFAEIDTATVDLPTEWNELFRAIWIGNCYRQWRSPKEAADFINGYALPLEHRISEQYMADWQADFLADDSLTPRVIRKSAIAILVRQRTPIYPTIAEVDRTIREQFVRLWRFRKWQFRTRPVQLTIAIDGSIAVEDAYVFDGFASQSIVISGTTGGASHNCVWVDSQTAAEMIAQYAGATGAPRYFYDVDQGSVQTIRLIPTPDKEYTAYAVILIAPPQFVGADNPAAIENLPPTYRGLLRDMVVATIASKWGRSDGDSARLNRDVMNTMETMAAGVWDNKGSSRSSARVPDRRGLLATRASGSSMTLEAP